MTELLEEALRQIGKLSKPEQDAAAVALLDYVQHMKGVQLTEAQVAEVRRRRTRPDRKLVSHEEAIARIARLGAPSSK